MIRAASRAAATLLIVLIAGGCARQDDYNAVLFNYRTDQSSNSITVTAEFGACDKLKSAEAMEQADRVTVTVTVSRSPDLNPPSTCLVGKARDITITLRAPLGSRTVIAADGYTVRTGTPTPSPTH